MRPAASLACGSIWLHTTVEPFHALLARPDGSARAKVEPVAETEQAHRCRRLGAHADKLRGHFHRCRALLLSLGASLACSLMLLDTFGRLLRVEAQFLQLFVLQVVL